MPDRVLIVAYGNPLRSDDAIAWRAADALEGKFAESDVEIIRLQQLGPELAETLRAFSRTIFIDAACTEPAQQRAGEIRAEEIGPDSGDREPRRFSHVVTPFAVLGLAETLYQVRPKAFLVTVIGENFGHGESLSAPVAKALPELISQIERLVRESLGNC